MNREDANTILHKMSTFLDNNQMMKLQKILDEIVTNEEICEPMKSSLELLESFIATKRLEGRSEKTLHYAQVKVSNVKLSHQKFIG